MRKKIIILSILSVFMLVAISFVTAASMQTTKSVKEKASPLFKIRKQNAINREKINEMKEKIRTWFIEGRAFLQFQLLRNEDEISIRQQLRQKYTEGYTMHTCCDYPCAVGGESNTNMNNQPRTYSKAPHSFSL